MISAYEQYFIELINRARLDPEAEAERQGIALNEGLAPGTIGTEALEVLSPNAQLQSAAEAHSQWMLDEDTFSHTGVNGSSAGDRITDAGYTWSTYGENLSVQMNSHSIDMSTAIDAHFDGLYASKGHRENTFHDGFREIGLGEVPGEFTNQGRDWVASMVTENFGTSGGDVFVTGVGFADADGDLFYDVGEGISDYWVRAGGTEVDLAAAGGYGIGVAPANKVEVTFGQGTAQAGRLLLDLREGNGKLDIIETQGGDVVVTLSASAWLKGGVTEATLLGVADLNLTGSKKGDTLTGNRGDNKLVGKGGKDKLAGGEGDDVLKGGGGRDKLKGDAGRDTLDGQNGNDVMTGGAGVDTFILRNGHNTITDYADGEEIRIKAKSMGVKGLSVEEILDLAEVKNGNIVLDFGTDSITLRGVTNVDMLLDDIIVF